MSVSILIRALRTWAAAAWVLLGGSLSAVAQTPPVPPVEAFFSPAAMEDAQLSPSGRWVAALAPLPGGRTGFVFIDLEGKEEARYVGASPKDDVRWFRWVSDDWLIYSQKDLNGHGWWSFDGGGLMSMKRDGSVVRTLIAREYERQEEGRRHLSFRHFYMAPGMPGSLEVIVGETRLDPHYEVTDVVPKVLNVATGAARTMLDKAPRATGWWFDARGRARVASDTKDGRTTVYWADAKTGEWRTLSNAPTFEQPFVPKYVDGDDGLVVNAANEDGTLDLRRFDFASGKPSPDSILKTPGFNSDVGVYLQRPSGEVLGIYVEVDAATTVWLSPQMVKLQAAIDAKVPGYVNALACHPWCDKDASVVLVRSYSDRDPGYYMVYRPKENKLQMLSAVRPGIQAKQMADLELHRTKARDGEDLPVWVTTPRRPAGAPAKPAPAVVLVHGGPHVRGVLWGWNAEAQFLASRGYVVIEPEFRGSTGYGVRHFRAGWKQWGRGMQDDVSDALKFAVDKGWVDASRVCIMGGSYGGYAALMGLVKDPDQYRCGIAFAAVSDPRFLYEFHWSDTSAEGRSYSLPMTVGDPKTDAALLAAASPLEHANRIKAPLLMAHGKLDLRVPIQSSERMLETLRKQGKDVEWVPYAEERHGFSRPENDVDYHRRVEAFLAKFLK